MTEKLVPIEQHREKDMRLVRKKLLEIINKSPTPKDVTDASKLLARMHKALQPDKTIEKVSPEEKKKEQELTDRDKKIVDEVLGKM